MKTNLNPRKPIKTNMEPWKTNLEPSKLTQNCTGWLWKAQVVTGDSKEEVIIFRDKHTLHHNIYIITIITIITIIIIIVIVVCFFSSARGMMCLLWVGPNLGFQCFEFKRSSDHKNTLYEITIWDLSSKRPSDWQGNARDQIMNQMTRKKSLEGKRAKQRNWLIVDPEIQIS